MTSECRSRFPRLVERAFVRGLPARQRRQLREHLASCASCRARWDRLAIIDRQLGGPALTATMIDQIGDAVLARGEGGERRRWWAWLTAGGVAVTAAAAVALLWLRPGGDGSTLSARGGQSLGRTPGVRLFCVAGDRDHVRSEARMVSNGPVPELRCMLGDDLQLAYTTPDREGLTMVAFGRLDSDSTIVHYAEPTMLQADRIDEILDWSTRLAVAHRPGRYDVVVRFFDLPVAAVQATGERVAPLVELHARLEIVAGGGIDHAP